MKVFVTGASGFIGSHLVRHLLEAGLGGEAVQVFCLVRQPRHFDKELHNRVTVLPGELHDLPNYREVVRDCEYVFHLAACASLQADGNYERDNVEGTRHLLAVLAKSSALQRLVFTSTIGAVDRQPADTCTIPLVESTPPFPLSAYGRSKLECERLIEQSHLPYTIIRPTWVYGPGMRGNSHVRVFIDLVDRRSLLSRLDFPGLVSVIYVDDLVASLVLVAQDSRAARQTFFVSDGEAISIGRLFRLLGGFTGHDAGRWRIPLPIPLLARRFRHMLPLAAQNLFSNVLWADSTELARLGFKPKVSQRQGLLRTVRWHLGQRHSISLPPERVTLVTGAAGGIGKALSQQLYARGHHLLLVDKNEPELARLARELEARCLCLDLTRLESLLAIKNCLGEHELQLHWVINNAGIGVRGRVADVPFDRQRKVIDLNCTALTFISHLALEHFRQTGRGMLINIASSAAFQPLPYMAVYAASKAYVLSFSHGITGEVLDLPDVHVLTVSPSGTATNFQSASGVKQDPNEKLLSPENVATQILHAANRRQAELIVGNSGRMMSFAGRILPVALQIRLWRQLMKAKR